LLEIVEGTVRDSNLIAGHLVLYGSFASEAEPEVGEDGALDEVDGMV